MDVRSGARGLPAWIRRLTARRSLIDGAMGVVIGIVTWPLATAEPMIGIDPSWVTGLHMAARERLSFGDDIVFTFGPLGFLGFPEPYLGWTSAAGLAFVGTAHLGATIGMFHLARRRLGDLVAATLVLATAFAFPWIAGWTLVGVLIFLASAVAVVRSRDSRTETWYALLMGVAVGVVCLGKLNIAITGLVIAGIGVLVTARDRRRSLLIFTASSVMTFGLLWFASGQSLGGLPTYLRSAVEFSAGYGQSMGLFDPQELLGLSLGAAATVVIAGLVAMRLADLPRKTQLALWVLFALMAFSSFKGGFTRQGIGMVVFVVTLLALWPAFVPARSAVVTCTTSVAVLLALTTGLSSVPIVALVDPIARWGAFTGQVGTVLFDRSRTAVANALDLRAEYGLPHEALPLLADYGVDIQPWEAAAAIAYPEIEWQPQPVFQAYAALTPYLDRLNADALARDDAPGRILWLTDPGVPLSIDGRSVWFDSPAAKIEMLCRYLPLEIAPTWQVLGRVPDRCDAPIVVGSTRSSAGARVPIPSDGPPGILTVRISGIGRDPGTQLAALAYRAARWWVTIGNREYRIPLGVNGEPVVIGATTDIGYGGALELSAPPRSLTVTPDEDAPGEGAPLGFVFEIIPLESMP
jgi:hypothetical protein